MTTLLLLLAAAKLSPFTDARIEDGTARVVYEGRWYELVELDGVAAGKILAYCRETYGDRAEKRFAEDLVEVLEGMGRRPGRTVSLVLEHPRTKMRRTVKAAPMTEENRRKVWEARRRRLTAFTAEAARADLRLLKEQLERHHSYRFRAPEALAALDAGPAATREGFALQVARAIARFGDGHTRVRGRWDWLPKGYAPFLARVCGDRVAAFNPRGDRLLAAGHPWLAKIDGVPVERWIEASGASVAHGSPAFRRWRGVEELVFLNALRRELEIEANDAVRLELAGDDGKTVEVSLPLADRYWRARPVDRGGTRMLDEGIGYLRIGSMDSDGRFLAALDDAMEKFAKAPGIVIDVRGNGGGSRHALRTLLPRFLGKPRVVNAAKRRGGGDLYDRFCRPADWDGWTDAERAALAEFRKGFDPEWNPPRDAFSRWQYMIMSPKEPYEGEVVVLMDGDCFSATDVFLGAFKGVDGVTLLGTPSGGGSGRSRKLTLPRTGVKLRVSTMASFAPTGRLYDGNGIEPDVVVEAKPSDWTGATDTQLAAAVRLLRGD